MSKVFKHAQAAAGVVLCCGAAILLQSCGYTSKTLLPEYIKTVHVEKVVNDINIAGEITSRQAFKVYRPGLEVELRNAIIERVVYDGHFKVADAGKADAVLRVHLVNFIRDPISYQRDQSIQEYRINVVASAEFVDRKDNKVLWRAQNISGNTDFATSGEHAISEDEAVALALQDLSRHMVENILEVW